MKNIQLCLPWVCFLGVAIIAPGCSAVTCYSCQYEDNPWGNKTGDPDCLNAPTSVSTVECDSDYCGKAYVDGDVYGKEYIAVYRGCEDPEKEKCKGEGKHTYKEPTVGLDVEESCSKGDLSNEAGVMKTTISTFFLTLSVFLYYY